MWLESHNLVSHVVASSYYFVGYILSVKLEVFEIATAQFCSNNSIVMVIRCDVLMYLNQKGVKGREYYC